MKHIIIIPGSCSHWSNWFDQINRYEAKGYKVDFLELKAYKFRTFIECSSYVFEQLASLVQVKNNEMSFSSANEIVIVGHSMGAMILLKILSEKKFFSNRNQVAFDLISKSKLVFVQVPLKVNLFNLKVLSILKYLIYPFLVIHRYFIYPWFTPLLVGCKISEKFVFSKIPVIKQCVNLFLNICLMHNAFWATKVHEFSNLNGYYKHWNAFSLDGFRSPVDASKFDRATYGHSEDTKVRFDKTLSKNYFFTYGEPDFFCDSKLTQDFANSIGANTFEINPNFHSPQHLFWNQKKFDSLVLEAKSEDESAFVDVYSDI